MFYELRDKKKIVCFYLWMKRFLKQRPALHRMLSQP